MRQPDIIVGDITVLDVDAIVNAANANLAPGGGVCGAIHRAAGPRLAQECAELAPCETGDAKITAGYDLPAPRVIHTVGPVYQGGSSGEAGQLSSCYQRSLELAHENDLNSIAFPCISTGIFGYPMRLATEIAVRTISAWLETGRGPQRVICCCFSEVDAAMYRSVMQSPD